MSAHIASYRRTARDTDATSNRCNGFNIENSMKHAEGDEQIVLVRVAYTFMCPPFCVFAHKLYSTVNILLLIRDDSADSIGHVADT